MYGEPPEGLYEHDDTVSESVHSFVRRDNHQVFVLTG